MSEDLPIGGVDHLPPETYRRSIEHAIGYVSYLCEKSGALNSGETALYWHLYHVVSSHMAPTIDCPAPSQDRET